MSRPVPNPGILEIAPYTPGKSPVPEPGRKVFKLSANETPLGPSPKAIAAYRNAADHLEDYPEGTSRVLREAIGRAFGLDPDRIICGAGSDEILNLLAHTYLAHGDEAISTTHGFLVYPIATMANGAINVVAPEKDFTADVDAILARVSPRTKLVWLANPNNPTGTYLPFDEVKRLRAGLPGHVLLVLDAAYSDYVSRNDYEIGIELVATTENTVMTHTFSKIHGLASLRIGWMFGPANIVDAVNRIRGPFNVSTPAMLAAVAAIEDTAHIQMSKAHTEKWRDWLTNEVTKLGFKVTPSVANFILIHFPIEKGRTAADADAFLTKRGLVLRGLPNYGLPHALRLTIGTEEANRLVVDGLRDFVAGLFTVFSFTSPLKLNSPQPFLPRSATMIVVSASSTSFTLPGFSSVPRAICLTTSPRERRLVAGVALNGFFFAVFAIVRSLLNRLIRARPSAVRNSAGQVYREFCLVLHVNSRLCREFHCTCRIPHRAVP